MVFSSVVFLSLFLPVFLFSYNLSRKKTAGNMVLVAFSLGFYAWGDPVWIIVLVFSGTVDYIHGIVIERWFGKWQAKAALIASLLLNLGILLVFKYSAFFISTINTAFNCKLGFASFGLPVGLSFYTFQTISYTIDVYRGSIPCQKNYINFMTYVTMFPQLVAGPIVRYKDIAERLTKRRITITEFSAGVSRFACGLGKKVLLANSAGKTADLFLGGELATLSFAGAWLGIVMFAFQIYFDFSGYSDMAIGLGKMIGFDFLENFNYPYISRSVTEFWRRWHISLGSFFRDYVYIPLGGNRRYLIRNTCIVWLLTGLWHGAGWNFVIWGGYYGIILIAEKSFLGRFSSRLPRVFAHAYSLFLILFGWSMFYFTDTARLLEFIKILFGNASAYYDYIFVSSLYSNMFLLIVLAIGATPLAKNMFSYAKRRIAAIEPLTTGILMIAGFVAVLGQTYNPFLYFRF